jgi:hypothetical protein
MDALRALAESNFEGRENYVAAQNVAPNVAAEEADLCGETPARFSQLNFQIEQINVPRTRKRIYNHTISVGEVFDSNQLCVLRTKYGEKRARVENSNRTARSFAVEKRASAAG